MQAHHQKLRIIPSELDEANAFVRDHHRHHQCSRQTQKPVQGHKFSLAVCDETDTVRGVAIVGRPVARFLDNGLTLEVTRVATDGCPNACSALCGACRRATFALGYKRLITYVLSTEPGTTLKAFGRRSIGEAGGGAWNRASRPRVDKYPLQTKIRWESVR